MVLFCHITSDKNVKNIIKDGEIKSYSKTKLPGIGEAANIMNPDAVFLTAVFDYFKVAIPNYTEKTYFFFDKNILTTNKPSHYCNSWEWGEITKECIKYKKSITPDENINQWVASYKSNTDVKQYPEKYIYGPYENFNGVMNEIIFKNGVNFESLVGIYSYNAKWSHPMLITSPKELRVFLYKYGIKDVDIDPRKHYYIPFSINWTEDKHTQVRNKWLLWASKQTYSSPELNRWKEYYNHQIARRKTRKVLKLNHPRHIIN